MLSIDQVKLLETKVAGAIELIKKLSDEKDLLKKDLEAKDKRIAELEALLLNFKEDQTQIEEKVISALNQLSAFEDSVYENKSAPAVPANSASDYETKVDPTKTNPTPTENNIQTKNEQGDSLGLKEKIESNNSTKQSNLQKDLADVLGTSTNESNKAEDKLDNDDDTDQQLDIF